MSLVIRRSDVVAEMEGRYSASVTERTGFNWDRVNTVVLEQGNAVIDGASLGDFHMLELCLHGRHQNYSESLLENGDMCRSELLPGKLSYNQRGASMHQTCEGTVILQQTYLDRSIFDDCASAMFKGDPDNVVSLGFQSIFEPELKSLAETLLEEARRPTIGSNFHADLIAQRIALLILRRQNSDRIVIHKDLQLSEEEVGRVISYIEEQIVDIGGLDTLAALVNMDVVRFTEAFKATTGESLAEFLINRRLTRVKERLRTTGDSLTEIACATGFANTSQMMSTFTKYVGVSPGNWRKAVRS